MPRTSAAARDTSIRTYRARRDFAATPEPAPDATPRGSNEPIFVVQKHDATRLHYDFRLEHGGVLWSWAVPKGPSLDTADKRLAVRTEDHPLDYADFAGTIPEGHYGAGTVETWDRGTWAPQRATPDAAAALDKGELKILLDGTRLHGKFVLIRLKPRPKERGENWLLIKEHDEFEAPGVDANALEASVPLPTRKPAAAKRAARKAPAAKALSANSPAEAPPVPGAAPGNLPEAVAPQLATLTEEPPADGDWITEVKFDGYRLIAVKDGGDVRLLTRNGHDWTARLPTIARAVARLKVDRAIVDGELVALRDDGVSSFALLQQALSDGNDRDLFFYTFDLLHLGGWDLRPCRLVDRKSALSVLSDWRGALRYSDHAGTPVEEMRQQACGMGLEGVICKQAGAPYQSGRSRAWLKLKCHEREEFIVLGFTPPAGSRAGVGSLHLGYRDPDGAMQYVGGVGTGFNDKQLRALRERLDPLATAEAPADLVFAGERPDTSIVWVRPELVVETQFAGWSGAGRIRHSTYLGLREDKAADEVVRPIADPQEKRTSLSARRGRVTIVKAAAPRRDATAKRRAPSEPKGTAAAVASTGASRAKAAKTSDDFGDVRITHADRELWLGISKRDLAEYWLAVAEHALPEIAGRPLALVRCPEGVDGERFFQKHAKPGFPKQIRAAFSGKAPYLVLDDVSGLLACAQVSAIELHAWGSREPHAELPDQLVFDLDPAEDVGFGETVKAAFEVRERLKAVGLESFCRTTGGKGLHIVAPLRPGVGWDAARAWCRAFAEAMTADHPARFVSRLSKAERTGKILVDWLRNGLGSTAVASFSPRARPGAPVATRLAWREVTERLDPAAFTLRTVPERLAAQRADAWAGFDEAAQPLPAASAAAGTARQPRSKRSG